MKTSLIQTGDIIRLRHEDPVFGHCLATVERVSPGVIVCNIPAVNGGYYPYRAAPDQVAVLYRRVEGT